MAFVTNFISRVSRGIRLFLFSISIVSAAFAVDTIEKRINQNAFLLSRYESKFVSIPREVNAALHVKIESVLTPVRLAPKSWFTSAFMTTPTTGDRHRLIENLKEIEIWRCLGESCQGCSGTESLGCVLSKKTSGGVGTVAVIHPCLYGEGRCPRGKKADVNLWAERVVTDVPFFKLGLDPSGDALRKARKKSLAWIHSTSRSVNQLLGSCPGPYGKGTLDFLREVGSVSVPNPAIRRCGETYLRAIRTFADRCPKIEKTGAKEWKKFTTVLFKTAPEILRCDSFCQKMLCRKSKANLVFTTFNAKAVLMILDGACEGATPTSDTIFGEVFPRSLRLKAEDAGCLMPDGPTAEQRSSTGELGNGAEVELVE